MLSQVAVTYGYMDIYVFANTSIFRKGKAVDHRPAQPD